MPTKRERGERGWVLAVQAAGVYTYHHLLGRGMGKGMGTHLFGISLVGSQGKGTDAPPACCTSTLPPPSYT